MMLAGQFLDAQVVMLKVVRYLSRLSRCFLLAFVFASDVISCPGILGVAGAVGRSTVCICYRTDSMSICLVFWCMF
jgi:hypothetical protein